MRTLCVAGLVLAMSGAAAAAPNVTNATQKGSLLIFPDIRVDGPWNTLIRIQNDGALDVDLICYWMDGNKNRVDFVVSLTRTQAIWFDAKTGRGTTGANTFPLTASNGFDNPYLITPGAPDEASDTAGPYFRGMLACWAVDRGAQQQIKWNHLSGTATVYAPGSGAYEYNAYAFFVPTGLDQKPVGTPGVLNLNGVEYDSCPQYQTALFPAGIRAAGRRLALASCSLSLNQDWTPVYTKLQFNVWNADDVKLTGAFDCADSWHETGFGLDIDAAAQNFIGTRYRVQGVASTQCPGSQAVGLLAVQSSDLGANIDVGTTLNAAGKATGRIVWDPQISAPEGGIR